MDSVLYPFFAPMSQWMQPRFNVRMQVLEAQLRMLRSRVDSTRIVPTPEERAELIQLGASLDHDIDELMHTVQPETYRKWIRRLRKETTFRMPGRPRIAKATRNLVLRIAGENLNWGHRRIVGELKKLGIRIGATTVRSILGREGHFPAPQKGASPGSPATIRVKGGSKLLPFGASELLPGKVGSSIL